MKKLLFKSWFKMQSFLRREEGQGMVEYGLIIALIAVVVIVALGLLGGKISSLFTHVANNIPN